MSVKIYGLRKAYKIKDPAGILEKIAKEIRKSDDPPEYNVEQIEQILGEVAKEFEISKMEVYLKDISVKNDVSSE